MGPVITSTGLFMPPLLRSLLLIASLATMAAARADGLYLEGGGLARRYDLGTPSAATPADAKGRSLSGSLRLGYELGDRWAVDKPVAKHEQ